MSYKDEIVKAMNLLARDERVIFIGQNVIYGGATTVDQTLKDIPSSRKIELPVMENSQLGFSLGLSLLGLIPVTIFPRVDFLIIACDQLVNHLDKIEEMSCGQYRPKVIIRAAIGSRTPLYPGPQHCQDHTAAIAKFLTNINLMKLTRSEEIMPFYKAALKSQRSSILIESVDLYNTE